jgi:predicted short-subunit dehydrogenase-like oxidoreductase (DUF2520 family)
MGERLMFVGPGRVGLALGQALRHADVLDELVYCGRQPEPPAHPLFIQGEAEYVYGLRRPAPGTHALVITVPDEAVPEMAIALAELGGAPDGCVALHCSGALSTDPLAPLHSVGYPVGSLHPLQSVAHPVTGAELLEGSYFAISGEPAAASVARRLVAALGGRPISIPVGGRPLYHAAAVMASNYTLTIVAAAARMLADAGAPVDEALEALLPLVKGTLENLDEHGPLAGLTGPIVRGDLETVQLHLRALPERERRLYAALGRETVLLAGTRLDPATAEAMDEILSRHEDA